MDWKDAAENGMLFEKDSAMVFFHMEEPVAVATRNEHTSASECEQCHEQSRTSWTVLALVPEGGFKFIPRYLCTLACVECELDAHFVTRQGVVPPFERED